MAIIQGFTTGAKGVLMMAPVNISPTGIATIVPASTPLPTSVKDFYNTTTNDFETSKNLELAVFSSYEEEVGIVSSSPNFSVVPKTFTFTIDRDDVWTFMFLHRYCKSLRFGLEKPSTEAVGTTAKQYEDGLEVRGDATSPESEVIAKTDTVFFVHVGPLFRDTKGAGKCKLTYGLVGIGSDSSNYTTAYQVDNQFTFTLIGAPQQGDSNITGISNYIFHSVVGANFGQSSPTGIDTLVAEKIVDGKIGAIFGNYQFWLPKNTSIVQNVVNVGTIPTVP